MPKKTSSNAMCNALEQLAEMLATKPVAAPSLSFAGDDVESPGNFIETLNAWFTEKKTAETDLVNLAIGCLRGEAAAWATQYDGNTIDWKTLADQLKRRFDNPSTIAKLKSRLYGRPQTACDSSGPFILRKVALFKRLEPNMDEKSQVCVIIELLNQRIRPYLRGHTIQTTEHLLDLCTAIEDDLGPVSTPRPSQNPPKCRYCDGFHWHNDCPVRQPGNRPGAGEAARPE